MNTFYSFWDPNEGKYDFQYFAESQSNYNILNLWYALKMPSNGRKRCSVTEHSLWSARMRALWKWGFSSALFDALSPVPKTCFFMTKY